MIRIIHIEDNPDDIGLIHRELKKSQLDFDSKTTDKLDEYINLLDSFQPDIILADYNLNSFTGVDALKILRKTSSDIPFILISGVIGEEKAVEAMKEGMNDYVMKDNLKRLVPVVTRELKDAEIRKKEKLYQEELLIFNEIFRNTNDVLIVANIEGQIIKTNPAFQKFFGAEKSDPEKKNISELFDVGFSKKLLHDLQNNGSFRGRKELKNGDKNLQLDISGFLLKNETDNALNNAFLVLFIRDITKIIDTEDSLRQSEYEKSLILNTTRESFTYFENDYTLKWGNKAAAEAVNLKIDELLNYKCHEARYGTKKPCKSCHIIDAKKTGKPQNVELNWPDGSVWNFFAHPIFDDNDKVRGVVEVGHDITERKKWEKALILAREKAIESDRLKSVFLANMSHEIRTPLNGILGFAELLKKDSNNKELLDHYLSIIEESGNQLLTVLGDIIEFAKIEANQIKMSYSKFDLPMLMYSIFEQYKLNPPYEKTKIEIILDIPDEVSQMEFDGDKNRLKQILTNLLTNAYKFTTEGIIRFGFEKRSDRDILFFVSDTGEGIPKQSFDLVFERFRQVDETPHRKATGTGLGLAICKHLIELMKGKIWLDSELGKGTTFYFNLPLKTNNNKPKTPSEKNIRITLDNATKKIKGIKILIAEDDDTNFFLIKEILNNLGGEILRATNGNEIIELAKKHPDARLILMDIKMPVLDGQSAFREIRKFNKEIPIIAETAFALDHDRKRFIHTGFDDYIPKPINYDMLIEKISKLL